MKDDKLYRIRNTEGLYSTGGSSPKFTKRGKIWTNIGHVKSHIHMLDKYGRATYRNECHLQTYFITETITDVKPIFVLMEELDAINRTKEQAARDESRSRRERTEREQLRALQIKYPKGA